VPGSATALTGCSSGPPSWAPPATTLEGIERCLGFGLIEGIGPVYARKLVQPVGEGVFGPDVTAPAAATAGDCRGLDAPAIAGPAVAWS
jgi:hypothetical protein